MKIVAFLLLVAAMMCAQQIPPGTALPVTLNSTLKPKKLATGQAISATIVQNVPLPSGGKIRAGSRVLGRVLQATATPSGGWLISIQFDQVQVKRSDIPITPITTSLRALASPLDVQEAQLPKYSTARRGESAANWITTQVGDDVVYRGGGHVMHGEVVVGDPVPDGVLAELVPALEAGCPADSAGRRLALWIFASSACGAYGFFDELGITHHGETSPIGEIVLQLRGNVDVPVGTGMLLIVINKPDR